jgi:KDO2-lipid IV(A) lauroyltransferase
VVGLTFYAVDRAHRRIAEQNLATAFPVRSATERRTIARAAFAHFGRLLMELLKFSTLSREQMLARVEFDGEERARAAYAHGHGVLSYGHFGFWELRRSCMHCASNRFRARPRPRQPTAQPTARNIRQRTGNTVIYRKGTIRRVMRTLQEGHGVAV